MTTALYGIGSTAIREVEEGEWFSHVDAGAGKKGSENLFKRILSYFAVKK